jgi:DNA topoisomerase-1
VPARKKSDDPSATPKPKKAPAKRATTASTAVEPAAASAKRGRTAPREPGSGGGYDLVIVESPAKAKTINKYLGSGYKVLASYGHVRDLATTKDRKLKEEVSGIQIDKGWKLRYLVDAGAKSKTKKKGRRTQQDILDELGAAAANANRVLLASDPDREGEAIAWHIQDALDLDPNTTKRIRFNEITKNAILNAVANAQSIDTKRVKSQEARRAMDRVVGFPLSNLLGKKVTQGLSAGRVQSVAVKLIVDRDAEIDAFITEEYWKVTALLALQGSKIAYAANPAKSKIFARKSAPGAGPEPATTPNSEVIAEEVEDTEDAPPPADGEEAAPAAKKPESKAGLPVPPKGSFLTELAKWNGADPVLNNEAAADAIVAALRNVPFVVTKVEQKDRQERPSPPFTTSTLQQQGNIRLRFSAKRTMDSAQRLYQGVELRGEGTVALITYMRTDSTRIGPDALNHVRNYIAAEFGDRYCPEKPIFYASGKSAQEAHECVRPTDVGMTPQRAAGLGLGGDDLKVYTLIYNRFVACQMAPAVFAVTSVEITAGPGLFRASGRIEKFDGYRKLMAPVGKSEDTQLPPLAEKQNLDTLDLFESQHFTQPPPRYNEASLVKALEKEGIGRPSTYASIIETIQNRGYVEQKDRKFFATAVAKVVTKLLVQHFPKIMDTKFTSHFEEELDDIETGNHTYEEVLNEFWEPFKEALDKAETEMPAQQGIQIGEACPKCGSPLVAMFSRKTGNKFIGCSAWKNEENPCPYKRGEDGKESMGPETTDIPCPAPGCTGHMIKRDGRFGVFYTCDQAESDTKCPAIMNDGATGPVVSTLPSKHPCPKCGKPILLKFSKTGNRYVQCTDTKGCKFIADATADGAPQPPPETGIDCDKCGAPMTIKKTFRGPFLACTAYPKCRNAKSINAELREKLKDILPPPPPKKEKSQMPEVEISELCPDCGSPMNLKQYMGRYFLGCRNYPTCRGTLKPSPEVLAQLSKPMVNA